MGVAAVICVLPGVLWTHASTTTACNRLPSLVTLCEVEDEEEDAEYGPQSKMTLPVNSSDFLKDLTNLGTWFFAGLRFSFLENR